jgi:hypothetical protein
VRIVETIYANNGDLQTVADLLEKQQAEKVDIVVPARKMWAIDGDLVVEGADVALTADGVTTVDGVYRPLDTMTRQIAERLGIPMAYARRMRSERMSLWDANVNGWLEDDDRSFLLRSFRHTGEDTNVGRALLSDRYRVFDNLDAIMAILSGVRDAGVDAEVTGIDLTESKMLVRILFPGIEALGKGLLDGYRSPFSGATGDENPIVNGGLVASNSETGGGSFNLVPRFTFRVCNNGMTITKDALRSVHLGGRLEEGTIRWSQDTTERQAALVQAKARDAVQMFADEAYVQSVIDDLDEQARREVELDEVERISNNLAFTDEERQGVLGMFVRGGQMTAGGVLNAITAHAQNVDDPLRRAELEQDALKALTPA